MNVVEKFQNLTEITEDMILPENIDHYKVWEQYVNDDPGAICGAALTRESIDELRQKNAFLYTAMGALNYLSPWGKILDVGAGYGSLRLLLNEYHNYVPVDVYPNLPESIIVDGNGSLPFEDNSFDFVYCSNVMQHIHENVKAAYFKEFYRVLKSNGKLFLAFQVDDYKLPPRFNDMRYAVTGNYFVPLLSSLRVQDMVFDAGLKLLSKTTRGDDFQSWWWIKP